MWTWRGGSKAQLFLKKRINLDKMHSHFTSAFSGTKISQNTHWLQHTLELARC